MDTGSIKPYHVTDRLLLRPWEPVDAEQMFRLASDKEMCISAGIPVHTSEEFSREVIYKQMIRPGNYAIVPKSVRKVIGAIDLKFGTDANICLEEGDAEIGYWIGREFWGNGYVPEAAMTLIDYGFRELDLNNIWCLCKADNHNSRRVQDKCGFSYVRNGTINDPLYGALDMRFTRITKKEWSENH